MLLDDLHWSDEATLEVLAALADPLATMPVLIVAGYRSDGLPRMHGVRRLRHDLRRAGRFEEIALTPLDLAGTEALLARLLPAPPSPEAARAVQDRTEGIPFFVEELAAALSISGALRPAGDRLELAGDGAVPLPDTVRDAVLIGVAELSAACRRAAEVAAVAGETFDLRVVAELASEAGVTELLESGVAREAGDGTGSFRHALTREALYADLPWMQRRALHRELAEALERHGASARDVAPQWLGAHAETRARDALLLDAAESEAVHAHRDATAALRQALELWRDGEDPAARAAALERYARSCQLSGELAEAARALRELVAAAGDDARVAGALRSLAAVHELRGDAEAANAARLDAAAAFAAGGQSAEAAVERIALANQRRMSARHGEAVELAQAAQADADRAGRLDLRVRALGIEGMALAKHRRLRGRPAGRPRRPGARARARPDRGGGRAVPAAQRDALRVGRLPARGGGARHGAGALPHDAGPERARRLRLLPRLRAARARRVDAGDRDLPRDDGRRRRLLGGGGPARRDPGQRGPVHARRAGCSARRSPSRPGRATTT